MAWPACKEKLWRWPQKEIFCQHASPLLFVAVLEQVIIVPPYVENYTFQVTSYLTVVFTAAADHVLHARNGKK